MEHKPKRNKFVNFEKQASELFDFDEKLVEDINIDLNMLADNNTTYKEYIMKNIINNYIFFINNTTSEDTESIFMFDKECDNKEENGNSINKTNNDLQSFQSTFKFSNTFIKKETTKTPNISIKNLINKTNTPKSIEKIIYTLPDLDQNQIYSEDEDDTFRDFDFTKFEYRDEIKDSDVEKADNETEELIKPLHASSPIEIVKKEQKTLRNNCNIFVLANNNIELFDDYIQNMSF